jgi:hypothetical protein
MSKTARTLLPLVKQLLFNLSGKAAHGVACVESESTTLYMKQEAKLFIELPFDYLKRMITQSFAIIFQ